jgi:hypothetical protein
MIQERLKNKGKISDEYRLKFIQDKKPLSKILIFASMPFK